MGRKNGAKTQSEPEYKVYTFSVSDERQADILIKARSRKEAEDYLADHQNEINWEALTWKPQGLEFSREKTPAFDPETFGGDLHLDASSKNH